MNRKLKIALAAILLAIIVIPVIASAAGLDFFGGKIKRRYSPSNLNITLLEIKGPPGGFNSVVIVGGTMLGSGCREGQWILGWGKQVSRGILNIFSWCAFAVSESLQ